MKTRANKMPRKVLKALNHVRKFFPDVMMVVFNSAGRWQYLTEDFNAPTFSDKIDVGILEDAANAVDNSIIGFPAVFEHPKWIPN